MYFHGDAIPKVMSTLVGKTIVAHNAVFDAAAIAWHYGINFGLIVDTLSMSRALIGDAVRSHSLNSIGEYLGYGGKVEGTLEDLKGLSELTVEQHIAMAVYNKRDVELCRQVHLHLHPHFPSKEYKLVDWTIKCFVDTRLELDSKLLNDELERITVDRGMIEAMYDTSMLSSALKFTAKLVELGVDPPMKVSKATGKAIPALAKSDLDMLSLLNHKNQVVRELVEARLTYKSNIALHRTTAFAGMASRGPLAVPLSYYGAMTTGRWSGFDGNFQNLPRGGTIRDAILAPPGRSIVAADYAQIELRVTLALAGEWAALEQLDNGIDLYCSLASDIFGYPVTKANEMERFIGKTGMLGCGFGTGANRFRDMVRVKLPDFTLDQAKKAVDTFREKYPGVPNIWRMGDNAIRRLHSSNGKYGDASIYPTCHLPLAICPITGAKSIKLPNNLLIKYPGLRHTPDGYAYESARSGFKNLFGGAVLENVVQALARIIMADATLRVNRNLPVVMTVHDELLALVEDEGIEKAEEIITHAMLQPVDWLESLPLDISINSGKTYGEAK